MSFTINADKYGFLEKPNSDKVAKDYTTQYVDDKISSEENERASADTVLQGNITAEAVSRNSGDVALQANITSEATSRISGDSALQANIDSEAEARSTGDSALQAGITAEQNARITADGLKVDKVSGMGLSENDYSNAEKLKVSENSTARHSHQNKSVLDAITEGHDTDIDTYKATGNYYISDGSAPYFLIVWKGGGISNQTLQLKISAAGIFERSFFGAWDIEFGEWKELTSLKLSDYTNDADFTTKAYVDTNVGVLNSALQARLLGN